MNKFVVLLGNILGGYTIHGPFDSQAEASDYAETCYNVACVAELISPEGDNRET